MCASLPVDVMNANNYTRGKKNLLSEQKKSSVAFAPLTFSEKSIRWRLQSKQNSRQTVTNAHALYCHLFFAPNLWIQVCIESISHMAKGALICSHCVSFAFKLQLFFFLFSTTALHLRMCQSLLRGDSTSHCLDFILWVPLSTLL